MLGIDAALERAGRAPEGTTLDLAAGVLDDGTGPRAAGRLDLTHRRGALSAFLSGEISRGRATPTAWEILTGVRWHRR